MIISKASRISGVKAYYFATKLQEVAKMNEEGSIPVLNLGIGSPDLLPPSQVISTLKESTEAPLANKYQSYRGIPELRTAFADWYRRWFDADIHGDTEVLPLMGSKEGIMHISMSFLEAGDTVLVPDPGYPAYKTCTEITGATAITYALTPENDWLPDLEALEIEHDLSSVKIMWINYPHMPTGATATLAFYKSLIFWARKHKILICSDNPYNFILNDTPLSPLQVAGAKDVCIELISLSKSYNMAGWRVGALIGRQDYIDTVLTYKSNMDSGMYRPIQEAGVVALRADKAWFDNLNTVYRERKIIGMQIMDYLDLSVGEDSAGMFLWGKISDTDMSSGQFIDEILYGARVFLSPGHIFGKNGEGYVRLSLCSTKDTMLEALIRIKNFKNSKL